MKNSSKDAGRREQLARREKSVAVGRHPPEEGTAPGKHQVRPRAGQAGLELDDSLRTNGGVRLLESTIREVIERIAIGDVATHFELEHCILI